VSVFLAVIASLAVVLGFITAVLGLINQRRIRNTATKVQQISVSVDGNMSGMLTRVDQLISSMHDQGAIVPAKLPAPPPTPPTGN